MISYFHEPPPEHLLELKFRELLLNILTNAGNSDLLHLLQSVQYTGKPSLEEVMEDNYLFNLTLEDFARIALRSLPTFKREFQALYHTTPGKWLLQRRLETAHQLLQNTARSVRDVAMESGFENITHFSRVYKEKYGRSPVKSRREILPATLNFTAS